MPKLRSRTTLTFNVVATSLALICQAAVGASVFAEETKPAEPAAASELEQLRAVLDTIPDVIFYKDRDGVYLGGNKAWRELIGDPVDFTGKTDFDLFPAEVAKGFREIGQPPPPPPKPRMPRAGIVQVPPRRPGPPERKPRRPP